MLHDSMTVLRKELREMLGRAAGVKGGRTGLLVFAGVFGVMMPLQLGAEWIRSPFAMVYWAWVPFLMVSGVVADSVAGERERHTLETLLASRLSDRAILFGKIGAAMAYGWGMTVACAILGAATLSVARGRLLAYPPATAAGIVLVTFLVALLAAGLGVLISLRASTVRQAQQKFSVAFVAVFLPLFAVPMLPAAFKARAFAWLGTLDGATIGLAAVGLLALADAALVAASMARFRRARLILD